MHYFFSCSKVVARLTISFHFLTLGSKSLLINGIGLDTCINRCAHVLRPHNYNTGFYTCTHADEHTVRSRTCTRIHAQMRKHTKSTSTYCAHTRALSRTHVRVICASTRSRACRPTHAYTMSVPILFATSILRIL